jgi:phosphate-selective porin OprO/OprP
VFARPEQRMRAVALVSIALFATTAAAQNPIPEDPLRHELDDLRARIHDLEQRLEESEARAVPMGPPPATQPMPPPPAPPAGARFHFGREGFVIGTADRSTEIRFRALVQLDGHAYFGEMAQPMPDTFLIRRARPWVEGTLFGIVDFRLMPEFGRGQASIADAYLELRAWQWLRLRAGKYRSPSVIG